MTNSYTKTNLLSLNHVDFNLSRFRVYMGNMAVMIAQDIIVKEGFEVWGTKPYHADFDFPNDLFYCLRLFYEGKTLDASMKYAYEKAMNSLKQFFGNKLEAFTNYANTLGLANVGCDWYEHYQLVRRTDKGFFEPTYDYFPDFVAKKNGEIYVVEVKTYGGMKYFKGDKLNGFLSAHKFGLIPFSVTLNLNIEASGLKINQLQVQQ